MTSIVPKEQSSGSKNELSTEEHEDFRLFGLIAFLIADGMTFAGFFAAYLTFKAVNPIGPDAIYELELPLPTLNTILLLVSSFTFHRAGKFLEKNESKQCQKWLLITGVLGVAFLISQMFEYFTLPFGLTDNLFASTFYALTGFHGLHVSIGVVYLTIVAKRVWEGRYDKLNDYQMVEVAGLYWHFVDLVWIFIFAFFYLW